MKRYTSNEMKNAYENGGYRERYAMDKGNKAIVYKMVMMNCLYPIMKQI